MKGIKRKLCAAAAALACLALCSCDFIDRITGNTTTTSQAPETAASIAAETDAETAISTDESETAAPAQTQDDASGGNPEQAKYINITVSEDKYFYENHEISYDGLLELLDGLDENTVVRLTDENASKKAYDDVIKALDDRSLLYEENTGE